MTEAPVREPVVNVEADLRVSRQAAIERLEAVRGEAYSRAHARLSTFRPHGDAATRRKQASVLDKLKAFDVERVIPDCRGLVLFGPTRTGKDHLLMSLAYRLLYRVSLPHRRPDGAESLRAPCVAWTSGERLFADCKATWGGAGSEKEVIAPLVSAELLLLSDPLPPTEKLHDWQIELLYRLLDDRCNRRKPTWATVNVKDGAELRQRLTPPLTARLLERAVDIACDWPAWRDRS